MPKEHTKIGLKQGEASAYILALAATAAAVGLRWVLDSALHDHLPLVTLFGAVAVGVWLGGYRPALLVVVLGYVACDYLFIEPRLSVGLLDFGSLVGFIAYFATCTIIIIMGEAIRRAQLQAGEERNKLAVTLASIGDAVIATDARGFITFLNHTAETLTGWKLDEAKGQKLSAVFRIVNEQSREAVENPALRAMREGVIVGLANHTVLVTKDGNEIPIDDSGAPIKDPDGKSIGAVLVFRDISERRRAERAHALLANIVESSEDAIISKNLGGIIDSWNMAAERLYEYTADEVIGKPINIIIPPDRVDEEKSISDHLHQGLRIEHFETVRRSKTGKLIDVSLTVSPVRDGNGEIVGASKIARDISARKWAEEALRQQRELLRVTLSSIGDGVISTDTKGLITFMNPVAKSLTGWQDDDGIGQPLQNVFRIKNEETGDTVENPAFRAMDEGEIVGLTNHTVLITRDGAEIPIDDSGAPIKDTDGRLLGSVLIFRDIAERRKAEKERSSLLAREQEARQLAEQANRSKDEFVAAISHEIRSPLNAILGWAQMLRSGRFNKADSARAIETIERNARVQAKLVEDLLELSRVITGKLDLKFQTVQLSPIIEAAVDSIRPTADAKSLRLDLHFETRAAMVSADPDRLQQILWNLLSNAVRFTPNHGSISVKVGLVDSQVQITVSDSGVGIASDFLPLIFDRFSQAGSIGRTRPGLGLGLAIVRHLVELHGGTVRADSPGVGFGATFTVTLPVKALREEASRHVRAGVWTVGPFGDLINLQGVRVVLVDDEAETRELLTVMLSQRGAEVRACGSGSDALDLIENWHPMVLVSDIGMPEMDGYDLIKKVRALAPECGGTVPAVALTAYARVEDRMRALTAGYHMHVPKPVEAEELVAVIASLAGRISPATSGGVSVP